MICGVKFEGPNKRYPIFKLILQDTDIAKYTWLLASEDVIDNYFEKYRYSGTEFEAAIQNEDCYTVSINLQAYIEQEDISEIHSFNDYLRSKCQMMMLIDDNVYINVYAKSLKVLNTMRNNALIHQFTNINYITDENTSSLEWL